MHERVDRGIMYTVSFFTQKFFPLRDSGYKFGQEKTLHGGMTTFFGKKKNTCMRNPHDLKKNK